MATNEQSPALRLTFLTVIVAVLLLALLSRLWFLQVLAGERYAEISERNRVQPIYTEAPRGHILAAGGQPLVANRSSQVIAADKRALLDGNGDPLDDDAAEVLDRLSQLLELPTDEIVQRLVDRKYSPFRPAPIAFDVPPEVVFTVREHQELFPGVVAETRPLRIYPQGTTAAHMLGYVAEISSGELDTDRFADYRAGDVVGKTGLERSYEQALQGERGRRLLEVNADGNVLSVLDERESVPGSDLVTSIDLPFQKDVERILAEGLQRARVEVTRDDGRQVAASSGAAVVLDVDTGAVLAMASLPTFDLREFVGGVSTKYFNDVYRDVVVEEGANGEPVAVEDPDDKKAGGINRAIELVWPPGSTFKVVTGAGFLDAGLIGVDSTLPCPPVWHLGAHAFRNWNSSHDGTMDITRALKRSCDTFFYEVSSRQYFAEERAIANGQEPSPAMQQMAAQFGLGEPLGIDLPGEEGGTIPDRAWKEAYWEANRDRWCALAEDQGQSRYQRQISRENCDSFYVWRGGDSVNMSIGQGFVTTTPLQIASVYAAIANDGKLMWPHIGTATRTPDGEVVERIEPRVLNEIPLSAAELGAIQDGLEAVVMDASGGTAHSAFSDFPFDEVTVAGKTGTAEAGEDVPFAWFGAYAPAEDAEIAVAVAVEEGSSGSQTAAPIARSIIDAWYGFEVADFEPGVKTD